ncbi:hypothetical protein [Malonomonas rubra]|uniref:hypothetical protein n=1 Tax=Malonomonas rubra TaxID=57040 RepID=UPI0026F263E2|nr:hypothetical protein [Malonomonas rubra]
MSTDQPMTEENLQVLLEDAGAKTMSRSGRNEHYGSPREYSFEVRGVFPNQLALQITARQYNYRDPWETSGRVNDFVDVALLRNNQYCELPKGYPFFQNRDTEEEVDFRRLQEIIVAVKNINPKLFTLQELTGDL